MTDEQLHEEEMRRRANPFFSTKQWICTEYGLLGNTQEQSVFAEYVIEKDRLDEGLWIAHIAEKSWSDLNDFIEALYRARAQLNIGKTTRDVNAVVRSGDHYVEVTMDKDSAEEAYLRWPDANPHLAEIFGAGSID